MTQTELIYIKTNINGYFFDAFLSIDHNLQLEMTEHPVQTGASITDHTYLKPNELTMEIGMSDVMASIVDGQFSDGGATRSINAFQILKELWQQRLPLQVVTRLGIYDNMIIQSIAIPDDYTRLNGLRATVKLKELLVATLTTAKISAMPHITDNTNKGEVVPKQSGSILSELIPSG